MQSINLSLSNTEVFAQVLARQKRTGIVIVTNRRGENSLIPVPYYHPDDRRQIIKVVSPGK